MDWKNVISSYMKAFAYDPDTKVLRVRFHNGKEWEYADVPPEKVKAMTLGSIGSYFHKEIKPKHEGKPVVGL